MKQKETTWNFFWCIKVWFFACLIQLVAGYIVSFLMGKFILTDERIIAWTVTGGPVTSLPAMQKLANLEQHIFIFFRSEVFAGASIAFIFFMLLTNRKLGAGFWTILALCFFGLLGLDVLSGWHYILTVLAECVPICGYAIVRLGGPPDSGGSDFENVGEYQRGARLIKQERSSKAFVALAKNETPQGAKEGISIWENKPFPYIRENQHILSVGSPGSGKTQIIYPIIEQIYKRGDKAIIWDVKGTFIQAFVGRPGVDLLAAWDKRSIAWSPGADIRSQLDCQQVASIMIPTNPRESQPYFLNAARQILEAIFVYLDSQGDHWGWGDVWEIISKDRKEVAALLSSFPDGRAVANIIGGDSKSTEDVYSTLIAHAQQTIRWYAKAWPKGGVSLRKWVHGNSKLLIIGGIPERADLAQATANIAIEVIINEILSMPDDPNRRIWLFLDELAALGKLESLLKAFSLGRSKGLCVVAGIQDIGKIEHHYGHMLAKSIANTFSTMIFLRCSDVDTSRWASAVLGEQDVLEIQKTRGESSQGGWGDPKTITQSEHKQLRTRPLFTPTEVTHFDNLTGVIRISGWPLLNVRWPYNAIPQGNKLIDEADWLKRKVRPNDFPQEPPASPLPPLSWRLDP